jgi:hypothetical protein
MSWLARHINHWICAKRGHTHVFILERYQTTVRVRNFKYNPSGKLLLVRPFDERFIEGKLKCGRCGCVYLGNVKAKVDNEIPQTP